MGNRREGVVHQATDGGLKGLVLQVLAAGLRGHPEYALGTILVWVIGVCAIVALSRKSSVGLVESVGDRT